MYISLSDLGQFIFFVIIMIVSGYLIAVLHRAFCVLGHVQGILNHHKDDISNIISGLPDALLNLNALTISLKAIADQTQYAIGSLQENITDTVDDLRDGIETFAVYGKIITEVLRVIFPKLG